MILLKYLCCNRTYWTQCHRPGLSQSKPHLKSNRMASSHIAFQRRWSISVLCRRAPESFNPGGHGVPWFFSLAMVYVSWQASGEGSLPEDSCWPETGLPGSLPHALAFWFEGTVAAMPLALFLMATAFGELYGFTAQQLLWLRKTITCLLCVPALLWCSALLWPCEPGSWSLPLRLACIPLWSWEWWSEN